MANNIIFEGNLLGVNCKAFKKVLDLDSNEIKIVKYTDKYKSFFKKIDGEMVEVLYSEEYKSLLNEGVVLLYKDLYVVKKGTKVENYLTEKFLNHKREMQSFMNGLLYNSLDDLSKFNMCKTYINEIKENNGMSDFFKVRLEGLLARNQEAILSSI